MRDKGRLNHNPHDSTITLIYNAPVTANVWDATLVVSYSDPYLRIEPCGFIAPPKRQQRSRDLVP